MESTGELLKTDVTFPKNWASAIIINLFHSHLLVLSSGDDLLIPKSYRAAYSKNETIQTIVCYTCHNLI